MRIGLIACTKTKRAHKCAAKDLYCGQIFKASYKYAKLYCDKIYILSAKYGLIPEDEEIEPYNITLNKMKEQEKKAWASRVLNSLSLIADINSDFFLILGGDNYTKYLTPYLTYYKVPGTGRTYQHKVNYINQLIALHK